MKDLTHFFSNIFYAQLGVDASSSSREVEDAWKRLIAIKSEMTYTCRRHANKFAEIIGKYGAKEISIKPEINDRWCVRWH